MNQFALSLEELGFSLALCGYDELSSGMLQEGLGELPTESWELIFQTASHGLLAKGLLLKIDEEDAEGSFLPEFKQMIDQFANTSEFIRCYNVANGSNISLLLHKHSEGFIHHVSINNILHILSDVEQHDLVERITEFYQPVFSENILESPQLSDSQFNLLIETLQDADSISAVENYLVESNLANETIQSFSSDYVENKGDILNISIISVGNEAYPNLEDVMLVYFTNQHSWVICNTNVDKTVEPTLVIKQLNEDAWAELTNEFISPILKEV